MVDYEKERMENCVNNVKFMQGLGLPVDNAPFSDFVLNEQYSDGHPTDGNLELEKDDSLQEFATTLCNLSADKTANEVTKRGGRKAQPHNQAGRLTKSNTKKARLTEISNRTTEEAETDAAEQNACQTEVEDNTLTVLNQDGSAENGREDNTPIVLNQDVSTENGTNLEDLFDEGGYIRGPNIGKKLDKLTRSRKGKLPLVIEPGKIRPNSMMIAAKFATECNIAVRTSIPIFPHWKEYKQKSSIRIIMAFIDRVCSKIETDKTSPHVKKACFAMLKRAVRQQRYNLKKKFFDAFPLHQVPKKSPVPSSMSDDQWDKLVEFWKNENRMLTSEKNKENRSKVQFHQTTGSRSYEMQLINLANKYQNEPPNALDKFKDLHYSKKKGFAPAVQTAIIEIEGDLTAPVPDGEQPKDVADVVAEVLGQKTKKKNSFLVNAGIKSSFAIEDNAESERDLDAELVMEKQTSNDLRELVKTQQPQMDDMMKKFQEAETARARQDEENKKKQAETDILIRHLMSMINTNPPPN